MQKPDKQQIITNCCESYTKKQTRCSDSEVQVIIGRNVKESKIQVDIQRKFRIGENRKKRLKSLRKESELHSN